MRRLGLIVGALVALAVALAALGAGGDGTTAGGTYAIDLDNAFGLVEGGDVKVAGVPAGKITGIDLTARRQARVAFRIDRPEVGSLRVDATCGSSQASLVGEYVLDCKPGDDRRDLPADAVIPARRSTSTVPLDLAMNVLRRPYRERLGLLVRGLGGAVAGRGEELDALLRRAVPAVRATDDVLRELGAEERTLRTLATDADVLLTRLAASRTDARRFVAEGRRALAPPARRAAELRSGVRELAPLLRQLTPAAGALRRAAVETTPVLDDLTRTGTRLAGTVRDAADLAAAARPALEALEAPARTGSASARDLRSSAQLLGRLAIPSTSTARTLRRFLEDVDDRGRAIEKDPRSPGGSGYTGLEALLVYAFNQTQVINGYDKFGHLFRAQGFADPECSRYATAAPPETARCRSWIGPTQPGINAPDPSTPVPTTARARRERSAAGPAQRPGPARPGARPDTSPRLTPQPSTPAPEVAPALPAVPVPPVPDATRSLLDFLLGA